MITAAVQVYTHHVPMQCTTVSFGHLTEFLVHYLILHHCVAVHHLIQYKHLKPFFSHEPFCECYKQQSYSVTLRCVRNGKFECHDYSRDDSK
jgi:hypothetical protein